MCVYGHLTLQHVQQLCLLGIRFDLIIFYGGKTSKESVFHCICNDVLLTSLPLSHLKQFITKMEHWISFKTSQIHRIVM